MTAATLRQPTRARFVRALIYFAGADVPVALSFLFVVAVIVVGIFAPEIAPVDPYKQNLSAALLHPGASFGGSHYLLGTDELGRDELSRLLYGIRPIGTIAAVSVAIAAGVGFIYGLLSGFIGGWVGDVAMRIADIQLSVPPIIIAILLAVALQPGVTSSIVAIALVTWPGFARVVRADTLRVRTSDYVQLARVAGLPRRRILTDHVVPNVCNSYVVLCTLNLSIAIIFAAALSFLGVGVQAPRPDWGNMLAEGTQYLTKWWLVVVPGSAITLLVLAINTLGDRLRDVLDPRLSEASVALGGPAQSGGEA